MWTDFCDLGKLAFWLQVGAKNGEIIGLDPCGFVPYRQAPFGLVNILFKHRENETLAS